MISKEIMQHIISDGTYTNSRGSTYEAVEVPFDDGTGVYCYSILKDGVHIANAINCVGKLWYNTPNNKSWRNKG